MSDIQQEHFECKSCDVNENYENFVQKLLKIVSNHAPLKSKSVSGNNDWRKAIYERTRVKNVIKNDHEITGTTTKNKEIFLETYERKA